MRIAIVSDIHGNLTALEAVIADLRETAPDVVLHGAILPTADRRRLRLSTGFARADGGELRATPTRCCLRQKR